MVLSQNQFWGNPFKKIVPAPYGKVSTCFSNLYVIAQVELPGMPTFEK